MLKKLIVDSCGLGGQYLSAPKGFISLPNTRSRFWRATIPDFPTYFLGRNDIQRKFVPVGQVDAQTEEEAIGESREKTNGIKIFTNPIVR
jgi:hypothetical protein